MSTNITPDHRQVFEALSSGNSKTSRCSRAEPAPAKAGVNGEPRSAIVAVNRNGDNFTITPIFVSVTPGMTLTDHDGIEPGSIADSP